MTKSLTPIYERVEELVTKKTEDLEEKREQRRQIAAILDPEATFHPKTVSQRTKRSKAEYIAFM
jgi:nitrate/nitrite-specific signal transduction histidine kinase